MQNGLKSKNEKKEESKFFAFLSFGICTTLTRIMQLHSLLLLPALIAAMVDKPAAPAHNVLLKHNSNSEYPLPRASLPGGFGAKMAYQTITRKDTNGNKVVSERLVRCDIEEDENGIKLFPCNPSFDTRK